MTDEYDSARSMFRRPLEDEEFKEWALELTGDDPARRAAMIHWLSLDTGFGVVIDYNLDRLSGIHVSDFELKAEHLEHLRLFPEIEDIRFERAKFSDEVLRVLSRQKHLTYIESEDASTLDNSFCQAVAELPKLESLLLHNASQINDDGAACLSHIGSLSGLSLNGSKISSHGAKHIGKLTNLTSLDVAGTAVDDDGLRYVATLPRLIWLELDNTKVTDAGVEHLRPLKSLRVLLLGNTAVTDHAVEVFASFDDPNRINLEGTKVTNKTVQLLAPFPRFGDINLRNTAVDDGCVPHFEKMKVLHTVDLRGTKISKDGMERIRASLKPSAALYNDHGVPVTDHSRAKAERDK